MQGLRSHRPRPTPYRQNRMSVLGYLKFIKDFCVLNLGKLLCSFLLDKSLKSFHMTFKVCLSTEV